MKKTYGMTQETHSLTQEYTYLKGFMENYNSLKAEKETKQPKQTSGEKCEKLTSRFLRKKLYRKT